MEFVFGLFYLFVHHMFVSQGLWRLEQLFLY